MSKRDGNLFLWNTDGSGQARIEPWTPQVRLLEISADGRTWTMFDAERTCGTLRFEHGRWTFEGWADDSARALFAALEMTRAQISGEQAAQEGGQA